MTSSSEGQPSIANRTIADMFFFLVHKAQEQEDSWVRLYLASMIVSVLFSPALYSAVTILIQSLPVDSLLRSEPFSTKNIYVFASVFSMGVCVAIYRDRVNGASSAEGGVVEAMARTVSGRLFGAAVWFVLTVSLIFLSVRAPVACIAFSLLLLIKPGYFRSGSPSGEDP
jgi:hypothetical protein